MRRLLVMAIVLIPMTVRAEYLDVIAGKLKEKCSLEKYVTLKNDFNAQWGRSHGYQAEIASVVQSNDLVTVYWLGRTANAEAFGRAWDAWRTEISDSKSVAAKLNERFEKCVDNTGRRGFDLL